MAEWLKAAVLKGPVGSGTRPKLGDARGGLCG
jgi:hypothetical protein